MMEYEIQKDGKFNYLEVGQGETLMLLHGLFGALSNFSGLIEKFRHTHKVVVPILPLFDLDLLNTSVMVWLNMWNSSLKQGGIKIFIY
jgi:2-hydroxy-6-oxonona-2,4-dienedioate hydrolase